MNNMVLKFVLLWNDICKLIFLLVFYQLQQFYCISLNEMILFCVIAEGQEDTILSYEPVIRQESEWITSPHLKKKTE